MKINTVLDKYYSFLSFWSERYYFIDEKFGIKYYNDYKSYFKINGTINNSIPFDTHITYQTYYLIGDLKNQSNIKFKLPDNTPIYIKFFPNIKSNEEFLSFIKLQAFS